MNHNIINDIKTNLTFGFSSFIKDEEIINWSGFHEFIVNYNYNINEIINFANYIEGLFLSKNKPSIYTANDIIHMYFLNNIKNYLKSINDKNILTQMSEDFNIYFCSSKKDTIVKILLKWIDLNKISNNIFFDELINNFLFEDKIMQKLKMEFLTKFSLNILNESSSKKPDNDILIGILKTYHTLNNQLSNEIKILKNNAIISKNLYIQEKNIMYDKIYNLKKENKALKIVHETKVHVNPEEINQKILCVVCISEIVSTIGKKCKHASCCKKCSIKLENKCPICRNNEGFESIYFN